MSSFSVPLRQAFETTKFFFQVPELYNSIREPKYAGALELWYVRCVCVTRQGCLYQTPSRTFNSAASCGVVKQSVTRLKPCLRSVISSRRYAHLSTSVSLYLSRVSLSSVRGAWMFEEKSRCSKNVQHIYIWQGRHSCLMLPHFRLGKGAFIFFSD